MGEFDEICERLGVSKKVKEKAENLLESLEEFSFSGQKMRGFPAAIFYAACRKMGVPRSYKELADAFEVDKEIVTDSLKFLLKKLDLHLPPYDPYDCLIHIVEKLDLSESVGNEAKEILERAEEENLVAGRNPFGVSASAVQIACSSKEVKISCKKIADAATVSTVSIRSRRKEMKNKLNINQP